MILDSRFSLLQQAGTLTLTWTITWSLLSHHRSVDAATVQVRAPKVRPNAKGIWKPKPDMATAEDQTDVHCGVPEGLWGRTGAATKAQGAQGAQGGQVFWVGPMLAVPLTSEKGCLGNMVNSMLRHICGHIYDIIRHNTTYCCIFLSSTPLRCPLCILCSRTAHRRTREAQRPSPRECVNHPKAS